MRDLTAFAAYRRPELEMLQGRIGGALGGVFAFEPLRVIAASGAGWDHVSVSCANRLPTWHEMQRIHRLFFKPDEWAMQLHAPATLHINCHPYVLHLWRPTMQSIPIPPADLV